MREREKERKENPTRRQRDRREYREAGEEERTSRQVLDTYNSSTYHPPSVCSITYSELHLPRLAIPPTRL